LKGWGYALLHLAFLAPAVAASAAPILTLESVGVGLHRDQAWGDIASGPDCSAHQPLVWRGPRSGIGDDSYLEAFQGLAESQAQKPAEGDKPAGPYLVRGRIMSMKLEACLQTGAEMPVASGQATMSVEWRVYSGRENEPVATLTSRGETLITQAGQKDLVKSALRSAFTDAARALFADPALSASLVTPAAVSPMASRGADPAAPMILVGASSARPRPPPRSIDSVVAIFNARGMGSGFLVSRDGLLLTNAHVVGKDPVVKVRWADGVESQARVLRLDQRVDVALIRAEAPGRRPLPLKTRLPEPGETVFAIGTPLEIELQGTLSRGIVSAIRNRDGQVLIQSDVSIAHGNSGGPLLDEKGNVIGMTVSGLENTSANLNFFVPAGEIVKALNLAAGLKSGRRQALPQPPIVTARNDRSSHVSPRLLRRLSGP